MSNLGVGLICLTICSIAFSIHESVEPKEQVDGEESEERYWSTYLLVRCIFRYVIGIMWMWSHKELFLNLSPAVATFICVVISICVIVHVVARSRDIDSNDEWFSKSKSKKSPKTRMRNTSHVSVPIQASGSTTSSTSPAIGVPYEAPPHDADGKPLIVGENINHHGAHDIGKVKVGVIGANAVRSHGGKIGGNINYGTNQNVGEVNVA